MSLAADKMRVVLSLKRANVQRYRDICRQEGMPTSSLSIAVDEFLEGIVPMMDLAAGRKGLSITDFFTYMGQQVQQSIEEEKSREEEKKHVVKISAAKKTKRSSN